MGLTYQDVNNLWPSWRLAGASRKTLRKFQIFILHVSIQQVNKNQKGPTDDLFKSHVDHINNYTLEFHFYGSAGVTFESLFKKYEDVLKVDFQKFEDATKVTALLRKLATDEHERYTNFMLPKNPRHLSFDAKVVT